jgi:hypothetical protein
MIHRDNIDSEIAQMIADLSPDEVDLLEKELGKIPPAEAIGISGMKLKTARKVSRRELFDFQRITAAEKQFKRLPEKDESFHCLMGGDYNGSDIIPAIIALAGRDCERVRIATLGFNKSNIRQMCRMFDDGDIKAISIACCIYFRDTSRPLYEFAKNEFAERGQSLIASRTHAKIISFEFAPDDRIVIESSANLRSCNNIEQLVISNHRELYEMHAGWIDHLHAEGGI